MIFSPNKPLKINTSIDTEKVRYDTKMPGRCDLFSCLAGCRETQTSDNAFLPKMELISITPHDPMSCSNVEERWYSCSFKMLLPLTRGMICNLCPNHRRWQGHGTSLKGCSTQFSLANRFVVGSDILLLYRCPWPCDNRFYNEDVVTRNVLVRLQPLEFVRSLWSNVCTMWAPSVSWLQRQEISKCRREEAWSTEGVRNLLAVICYTAIQE